MDTFISDFIKALPDALATAVVTILLSGGMLFVFQEKIKNFFSRSLFEYQTKFTVNHAKAVDALLTLYQKFVGINDAVEKVISARRLENLEPSEDEWIKRHADLQGLSGDFWNYYRNNRLFLPSVLADTIADIYFDITSIKSDLFVVCRYSKLDHGMLQWIGSVPMSFTVHTYGGQNYSDPELLIKDVRQLLVKQGRQLEDLYKSVAEAK